MVLIRYSSATQHTDNMIRTTLSLTCQKEKIKELNHLCLWENTLADLEALCLKHDGVARRGRGEAEARQRANCRIRYPASPSSISPPGRATRHGAREDASHQYKSCTPAANQRGPGLPHDPLEGAGCCGLMRRPVVYLALGRTRPATRLLPQDLQEQGAAETDWS